MAVTFEDRLTALETVVERLERGELSLDESVRLFEEGVKLSNSCKAELERAEGRIQILVETTGDEMQLADLDEDARDSDDAEDQLEDEEDEE